LWEKRWRRTLANKADVSSAAVSPLDQKKKRSQHSMLKIKQYAVSPSHEEELTQSSKMVDKFALVYHEI